MESIILGSETMDIDKTKREEWEAHIHTCDNNMLAIWVGHVRGNMYGNFSFRKDGKILEFGPGFHLRRELFDFYLSLPLDWKKIIDSELSFGENIAEYGVNLSNGEFSDDAVPIEHISSRVLKEVALENES